MFEKSLFDDIRFPIGKLHEDEFTIYKLIYKVDKIAISNKSLYNYRFSPNSITKSHFKLKNMDALNAYKEKLDFYKEKNENELYNYTLDSLLGLYVIYYVKVKRFFSDKKLTCSVENEVALA
jgi:hypothetical protein